MKQSNNEWFLIQFDFGLKMKIDRNIDSETERVREVDINYGYLKFI